MKTLKYLISAALIFSAFTAQLNAQQDANNINDTKQHPIYNYGERALTAVDTIPEYAQAEQKLKISGTIFENDGITPAKDVIVFIYQTNEDGKYDLKTENEEDYIYHRAWVKTNEEGEYTFFTFIPGTDYGSNEMKHIHTVIKEPNTPEYDMDGFLFENDPYLSRYCRKKLKKAGATNILNPEKSGDILVAQRDIVLPQTLQASK